MNLRNLITTLWKRRQTRRLQRQALREMRGDVRDDTMDLAAAVGHPRDTSGELVRLGSTTVHRGCRDARRNGHAMCPDCVAATTPNAGWGAGVLPAQLDPPLVPGNMTGRPCPACRTPMPHGQVHYCPGRRL